MKLLILFVVIPLIELYVMIAVGSEVGALSVILWTIAGAFLGVYFIRQQGLGSLQAAQVQMQTGQRLEVSLFESVFIFIGGALLFLPGLITDTIGLLMLIPFVRAPLLKKSLEGMRFRHSQSQSRQDKNVYEGEFSEAQPRRPEVLEGEVIDSDQGKSSK